MLGKDPIRALERKLVKFTKNKGVSDFLKMKRIPNPACPRLFANVKTHKTPLAFRPIVEKCKSPLYNLDLLFSAISLVVSII